MKTIDKPMTQKLALMMILAVFTAALLLAGTPQAHAAEQGQATGSKGQVAADLAAGTAPTLADGSNALTTQANYYYLWVGGRQITSANASNVFGDGKVAYNAKTNTLTLKNARIKGSTLWDNNGSYRNDGIVSTTNKALTIRLIGKSTLTVPYRAQAKRSFGIDVLRSKQDGSGYDQGSVVFTGTGRLTVSAAKASGYSAGLLVDSMTMKQGAQLVAKGAWATDVSSNVKRGGYGVAVKTKLRVQGSAKLVASGSTAAFYGFGFAVPTFGSGYKPLVKAGSSAKSISVTTTSPQASVYTSYRYVGVANRAGASSSTGVARQKITKLTATYGGFKCEWKKMTSGCSGYQIQYSTNSNFTSTNGYLYTGSTTNLDHYGFEATGRPSNTTHYVRVRSFYTKGSKTVYGAWSPVRSIITK